MEKGQLILNLLEKTSLVIVLFMIVTKIKGFKYIFQKEQYKLPDLLVIALIFSILGIIGTYNGIDVNGSIANTRIIAIVCGGILFGPTVGITSGIIAGLHRYLIDIGGITAMPCFISTVCAGILAGILNKKAPKKHTWFYGILCGIIAENIDMLLIYLMSRPQHIAIDIIKQIYLPMMVGQIAIGILVTIVQEIKKEREEIAARQAKLALDIANQTLPYFRSINQESLKHICQIIKEKINSDAVSITDNEKVLAYVGIEETKLKTAMVIPLNDKTGVIGSLKIYYTKKYDMSHSKQSLAIGLSQIISTLMEISKIEKISEAKNKAEIKALQTQINPHFLFNALNTITSFIRINPNKARELIINLSTYMRYNLEVNDDLIDIHKELEQVKAYVEIEKARFGEKLKVIYNIDNDINKKIPSLIIQPLVENAIIHGLRQNGGYGTVTIGAKQQPQGLYIWIENNGVAIDQEIIDKVYNHNMPENKIGLYNVHHRLELIYGQGLTITRLDPGTKIEFII